MSVVAISSSVPMSFIVQTLEHIRSNGPAFLVTGSCLSRSSKSRIGKWASDSQNAWYVSMSSVESLIVLRNRYTQGGTLQFMSVALLSVSKSVEICDELEAFFYVLLYYAARYLQSNVHPFTLANYLDAFFDQYTATKEGYECGVTKMRAIETGKLVIREGLQLRFGGPIDDLIAILLQWFKSHHVVTVYNRRLEEDLQRQAAQAPKSVPPRAIGARPSGRSKLLKDRMNRPGQGSATSRVVRTQGKPSSEDWEDWENVKTHRPIIELFDDHLFEAWPKSKNIGDRIPKLWVRPVLDSAATKTTSSNKRARADHKAGMVTAFPIPPSQRAPPQSPRHAATSPDAFWIHQAGTKDPESLPP